MSTRAFSGSDEFVPPDRNVAGAPEPMRVEFTDVPFSIADRADEPTPEDLYVIIGQTLGIPNPAAQPYGGFRRRTQRYLQDAEWTRFYDVVLRLWNVFSRQQRNEYRDGTNAVLAAHGIVWQMTDRGQLERVLPVPIAERVTSTIEELRRPGYEAARQLFGAAIDAFNAIPRRDRDAATNAFDAMESAAKIRLGMPNATFGQVLDEVRRRDDLLSDDAQRVLRQVEVLRHHHLGHGMAGPFNLAANEVDFVYVMCAAGIRLFARL